MAKTDISLWSTTAASNTDVGGNSLQESVMLPSGVNNSFREALAQLAKFYDDIGGNVTMGGTANALTATSASGFTALATGLVLAIKPSAANTTAATINVDGLGVKAIRRKGDSALSANDMLANGIYLLRYDAAYNTAAGAWVLLNPESSSSSLTLATGMATFLASGASADFIAAMTDETGTGALVFANSPTLVTPALGTPASGVATNLTGTAASLTAGVASLANALKSATTTVDVSAATAPSATQVLTATDSTHATWQTPASGSGQPVPSSSTYAVGTLLLLNNASGSNTTDGSTIAGSALKGLNNTSAGGITNNGVALSGTWKNVHGATVNAGVPNSVAQTIGYFVRTV